MIIKDKIALGDLTLQTLTPETVSGNYAHWLNDPQINRHTESRFRAHTQEDAVDFVKGCNARSSTLLLGIFSQEKHIGNIKADLDMHHRTAGIGILIGEKDTQSKGIGSKTIELFSNCLFSDLNIFKINAGIYQSNSPSLQAFKKAGFEVEYIKKAHVINEENQREDVYMMVKYAS